jgi:Fic family protein
MSTLSLDMSKAVGYHYGSFPPTALDYSRLMKPLATASAALARYDQMLQSMHNSAILLAPLQRQEAVESSRIEGTITTLDELLQYEADQDEDNFTPILSARDDTLEVYLYERAMTSAQRYLEQGYLLDKFTMRSTHQILLGYGRGSLMAPGVFKTEQNYLADRGKKKILFVPISPEQLDTGLDGLFNFIHDETVEIHVRTALAHLEFEALHPFKDGNGRIGRMLITLMLWQKQAISAPHFYVSSYFEQNKNEYIDRMRDVSATGAWTEWVIFFLQALEEQAKKNLDKTNEIRALYEDMKERVRMLLSSQWSTKALDFLFERPVFRNNVFTKKSGVPHGTAYRFINLLLEDKILRTILPASGRRAAMYAFEPLLKIVRG